MKAKSIQRKSILWPGSIVLLSLCSWAQAAVFCSVSSPGFTSAYVPINIAVNITSSTFSVTCTRDNAAGPPNSTVKYQIAAGNGLNALATQNRAALAGSFINYNLTTDAACATAWKGATVIPTPAASFPLAKGATATFTHTYYGCIPAGQAVLPPEGTYTDAVAMTFAVGTATGGASTFTGGAFPVAIIAPASCNITTPPGNIVFNYTSFSPTAVLANSPFNVRCTTSLAYSMSLDATTGVIAGLNYSLALNTVSTGGANPLASTGNGVVQSFFVNGTIAAGQGGTCTGATCVGSQTRTLTVTY